MGSPESPRQIESGPNYWLLRIPSSLDIQTSEVAEKEVKQVDASARRCLIVDMSECAFVSSSGIRFLVIASKQFRSAGGEMVLAGVRKSVRDLLSICGLGKMFPTHDSVDAAISSLK